MILMSVLEMEPGEPLGLELLKDFLTFMKGFVSIPINLPWTHHGKAIKVLIIFLTYFYFLIKRLKFECMILCGEYRLVAGSHPH